MTHVFKNRAIRYIKAPSIFDDSRQRVTGSANLKRFIEKHIASPFLAFVYLLVLFSVRLIS